jgi:hypothetical protein
MGGVIDIGRMVVVRERATTRSPTNESARNEAAEGIRAETNLKGKSPFLS